MVTESEVSFGDFDDVVADDDFCETELINPVLPVVLLIV